MLTPRTKHVSSGRRFRRFCLDIEHSSTRMLTKCNRSLDCETKVTELFVDSGNLFLYYSN